MKNKIWPRLIILFLLIVASWFVFNKKPEDLSRSQTPVSSNALFIQPNGEVTAPIVRLLGLTGIRIVDDPLSPENDWPEMKLQIKSRKIEDVVPVVQGKIDSHVNWLGDPKKERWEEDSKKPKLSRLQANHIIDICLNSLEQQEKTYPKITPKGVLFLGATLSRVRMRLAYLNELYETKILSSDVPVYILTGERKLDEKVEETPHSLMDAQNGIISFRPDWKASEGIVTDEGEMMRLVFSQSAHPFLDEKKIISVYSPKGKEARATTASTIVQWLKEYSPPSGTYVAISSQPYNYYQEIVIQRVLLQVGRSDIVVEVVGPGMDIKRDNEDVAIDQAKNLLNNLSRILYEFQEIRKITN